MAFIDAGIVDQRVDPPAEPVERRIPDRREALPGR